MSRTFRDPGYSDLIGIFRIRGLTGVPVYASGDGAGANNERAPEVDALSGEQWDTGRSLFDFGLVEMEFKLTPTM